MKPTKLQWEDVIRFEEVEGYGKSIWKNKDKYYLYYCSLPIEAEKFSLIRTRKNLPI